MKVGGSHFDVVRWCMVFGEVVSQVQVAALPVDLELALLNAVLDPVEPHVHYLRASDFGSSVCKSVGGGVVGCNPCWVDLFSA